jgi:hypothetical protein
VFKNFITILGPGNILLADEGFGVHFIRWFLERYRLPDDVIFLCIVPEAYDDTRLEMTPTLQEKFPNMEALLLKELSLHGIVPKRIGHA